MSIPYKVAFFEVKDWERSYIYEAFSDKEAFLTEKAIDEEYVLNCESVEIISTFINSGCSEEILKKYPNLKLIATRSTGYDHIDLDYCRTNGVKIANVPNYGEDTVAEHAVALLLALAKRLPESIDRVKSGHFSTKGLTGFDIKGKVVGVIGTGHIGRNFISMLKGFEANMIAYDIKRDFALEEELGFTYVELDYLFSKSDVISLHVPYLKSTHHIINTTAIKAMKDGVVIINTSRGGLVDTFALYEGLKSGKIKSAGLDVLEEESAMKESGCRGDARLMEVNDTLIHMSNVVVTPHNAFNTTEALVRIIKTTIENIKSFMNNGSVNIVS